jgi:hypothetical protein
VAAPVGGIVAGVVNDVIGAGRADLVTWGVLQTPVTSAPNAFASCTENEPTPPPAPMINTFCPGWTWTFHGGPAGRRNRR